MPANDQNASHEPSYESSTSTELTLDSETFRRLGYHAVDLAADYLEETRSRAAFHPMLPDERQALLEQVLPLEHEEPAAIVDFFQQNILSHPMGNGHPRFFGWVNSPPSHMGILAELLAATIDPSCAGGDHAAIYLER